VSRRPNIARRPRRLAKNQQEGGEGEGEKLNRSGGGRIGQAAARIGQAAAKSGRRWPESGGGGRN
jgi:hypothetical protein